MFQKTEIKADSADNVLKAGCVSQNYIRNNKITESNVDDIEKMPDNQFLPCNHTNCRSASSASSQHQFNTDGSVPQQPYSVSRGKYKT
jgi:hypothetical protein